MAIDLNPLERKVLEMLLAGEDPALDVLREQYRKADIVGRELTGGGFYIHFTIPPEVPRLEGCKSIIHISDVEAHSRLLPQGAAFILDVRDGTIDFLEAVANEGPWPDRMDDFRLAYEGGHDRDLAKLRRKMGSPR